MLEYKTKSSIAMTEARSLKAELLDIYKNRYNSEPFNFTSGMLELIQHSDDVESLDVFLRAISYREALCRADLYLKIASELEKGD